MGLRLSTNYTTFKAEMTALRYSADVKSILGKHNHYLSIILLTYYVQLNTDMGKNVQSRNGVCDLGIAHKFEFEETFHCDCGI